MLFFFNEFFFRLILVFIFSCSFLIFYLYHSKWYFIFFLEEINILKLHIFNTNTLIFFELKDYVIFYLFCLYFLIRFKIWFFLLFHYSIYIKSIYSYSQWFFLILLNGLLFLFFSIIQYLFLYYILQSIDFFIDVENFLLGNISVFFNYYDNYFYIWIFFIFFLLEKLFIVCFFLFNFFYYNNMDNLYFTYNILIFLKICFFLIFIYIYIYFNFSYSFFLLFYLLWFFLNI